MSKRTDKSTDKRSARKEQGTAVADEERGTRLLLHEIGGHRLPKPLPLSPIVWGCAGVSVVLAILP